jgi:DNA-binding transcriptional regulator LsrR (DeoR family)
MGRPPQNIRHIFEKRTEIIWALSCQDYNGQEIADMFNISRSVVNRILANKPSGYTPKWKKA